MTALGSPLSLQMFLHNFPKYFLWSSKTVFLISWEQEIQRQQTIWKIKLVGSLFHRNIKISTLSNFDKKNGKSDTKNHSIFPKHEKVLIFFFFWTCRRVEFCEVLDWDLDIYISFDCKKYVDKMLAKFY